MVLVRHFRLLGDRRHSGKGGKGGNPCPKINEAWSTDITEVVQDVSSLEISSWSFNW